MDNISKLLDKFKNLGNNESELKQKISEVIEKEIDVRIEPTSIKYKNGTV